MVFRHERGAHAALRDEAGGARPAQAQLELIDLRLSLWSCELGRGRMPNERVMLGIDALLDQRLAAMERLDALGADARPDAARGAQR
jgi:hypothetical protein